MKKKYFLTIMSSYFAEVHSAAADSDSDLENNENKEGKEAAWGRVAHGLGELKVSHELLDAFTASLDSHKIRLHFFAGSWASLRERLPHQGRLPHDIVLASETIYIPRPSMRF